MKVSSAILSLLLLCFPAIGAEPLPLCLSQSVYAEVHLPDVQNYYRDIDDGNLQAVIDRFSDSAVYQRGNFDPFVGKERIAQFFAEERKLRGVHHVESVEIKKTDRGIGIFVVGSFDGSHLGKPVGLRFTDYWQYDISGKIIYRESWIDRDGM